VENRYVGLKSRGVYETPGGTVLRAAFQAVESLTLDREVMHLRDALVPRYAEMVYYGYWFAPERVMLQAAIDEAARAVTGTARLRLYRGGVRVSSPGWWAHAPRPASRACAASPTPAASASCPPTRTSTWRSSGG